MEITQVKVQKVNMENSRLKGIASMLIDDVFAIHYIRIIEGNNGLFIAMPNRKIGTGEYKDVCYPINQKTRDEITYEILKEYVKCD